MCARRSSRRPGRSELGQGLSRIPAEYDEPVIRQAAALSDSGELRSIQSFLLNRPSAEQCGYAPTCEE